MGGAISQIFGGGGYDAPDPVQYTPAPVRETAAEPESKAARDEERRKLRARRGGIAGSILNPATPPTGANSGGILGRIAGA